MESTGRQGSDESFTDEEKTEQKIALELIAFASRRFSRFAWLKGLYTDEN